MRFLSMRPTWCSPHAYMTTCYPVAFHWVHAYMSLTSCMVDQICTRLAIELMPLDLFLCKLVSRGSLFVCCDADISQLGAADLPTWLQH